MKNFQMIFRGGGWEGVYPSLFQDLCSTGKKKKGKIKQKFRFEKNLKIKNDIF